MAKVTAIIPCFNEEKNIKRALESVSWADEIMIVDSFSTDKTLDIAKKYTNFIIQKTYVNSANQKNWAIPQATHDWIFLLDADEEVPSSLQKEIKNTLKSPQSDAYWIKRQNFFMEQPVLHSGIQNDKVIRLFKKSCRYEPLHVHAEIITAEITIDNLKHKLNHYTFKSVDDYMKKMHRYAEWSARDYLTKTSKVTLFHLMVKPAFRFFKHFFLKSGFRDGRVGFILSAIFAWGVFLRYWKMIEIKRHQ